MERILYRTEGRLFPEATRSHLQFRLFLEKAYASLEIRFSYAPKLLENPQAIAELLNQAKERYQLTEDREFGNTTSLQNLLTLSFDDAHGFRGGAHRHPSEQILTLGGENPSPGLLPGPVPQGMLRITLSVHAVLTESCTYHLALLA